MHLHCEHCGRDFDLPEHKLPPGGRFRFTCPACKGKNQAQSPRAAEESSLSGQEPSSALASGVQVEPDLFPPGSSSAFLFVQDQIWLEAIQDRLNGWGFYQSASQQLEEARQKLRLNAYQMVFIQQVEQSGLLLQEVAAWPGIVRREVNVLLIGKADSSFDPALAFYHGVNACLALQERDQAQDLLEQARENFNHFLLPWQLARDQVLAKSDLGISRYGR